MKIFKFGGASVKDAESVKNVYTILEKYKNEEILVVISAMAKNTNSLEDVWKAYITKDSTLASKVKVVEDFHFKMIDELFENDNQQLRDEITNLFVEFVFSFIVWICNIPCFHS